MCREDRMDAPKGAIRAWFPEKSRAHPPATGPRPLPYRGPAHSPATPPALPCPRARNARIPQDTLDTPLPSATIPSKAQGSAEGAAWMRREAQQGCAERCSMGSLQRQNREPIPSRVAPACFHARKPVTPQTAKTPQTPATLHPRHLPRSEGQRGAEGAAWMFREAQQGIAARRNQVEFPEKSRTHPRPRAIACSPAVGPGHSHATPQAFPCPRARNAPYPPKTPRALWDFRDPTTPPPSPG